MGTLAKRSARRCSTRRRECTKGASCAALIVDLKEAVPGVRRSADAQTRPTVGLIFDQIADAIELLLPKVDEAAEQSPSVCAALNAVLFSAPIDLPDLLTSDLFCAGDVICAQAIADDIAAKSFAAIGLTYELLTLQQSAEEKCSGGTARRSSCSKTAAKIPALIARIDAALPTWIDPIGVLGAETIRALLVALQCALLEHEANARVCEQVAATVLQVGAILDLIPIATFFPEEIPFILAYNHACPILAILVQLTTGGDDCGDCHSGS